MTGYALSPRAREHVDAIYDYTAEHWGEDQADIYIAGLFDEMAEIASRVQLWRRLPAEFGVDGFRRKYRSHVIYWYARDGDLRVVAVLHGQMDQVSRVRATFAADDRDEMGRLR